MRIVELCVVGALTALVPHVANAQPYSDDVYATVAPGEPVESVDVFEDQLAPYGVWVDDPSIGHVFIPQEQNFVPYTNGHWEYTDLGFVWQSSYPFAWATSHYGRWAYSQPFGRWVWLPDTEWGPAWVEWRETPDEFGWAPLPPTVVVNTGYQPPIESWHYCNSAHILDVDVVRHYEPRERVVTIHRQARPIEHYATVSNVRVRVGPKPTVLRERHVAVRQVKVEPKVIGRVTQAEARAQVTRARERRTTVEEQNRKKIESNATLRKVVQEHPSTRRPDVRQETKKPEVRQETKKPEVRQETKKPEVRQETKRPEVRQDTKRPDTRPEVRHEEPTKPEVRHDEPKRTETRTDVRREPDKKPEPQVRHDERRQPEAKKPEPKKPEPKKDDRKDEH